tara:strand:- start:83 stop:274 length:192 start_codon:yes stop_codon:yes gene_type:complete
MKDDFMWMESKEEAFDVIASIIFYQDPIEAQDRWLKACKLLGFLGDLAQTMAELEESMLEEQE